MAAAAPRAGAGVTDDPFHRPVPPKRLREYVPAGKRSTVAAHANRTPERSSLRVKRPLSPAGKHDDGGLAGKAMDAGVVAGAVDAQPSKRARTTKDAVHESKEAKEKVKAAKPRAERDRDNEEAMRLSHEWQLKYGKAFPTFTFYFDAVDAATENGLRKGVQVLGAAVDNFFSKKVTHVITTRQIPNAPPEKENVMSPPPKVGKPALELGQGGIGPLRNGRRSQKPHSPITYVEKRQPFKPDLMEKNPFIDSQDILLKALDFGLKIWRVDKLQRILGRMTAQSPGAFDPPVQRSMSLPSLLRDERLYGTRERDPFLPRIDMHYFHPRNNFVLVEDVTGSHRPIIAKEYEPPARNKDPPWPVLFGGVEGRSGFYHYQGPPIVHKRRLPPPQALAAPAPRHQLRVPGPLDGGNAHGSLRRQLSMNQLQTRADGSLKLPRGALAGARQLSAFPLASGNSQPITSNINGLTSKTSASLLSAQVFPRAESAVNKRFPSLARNVMTFPGGAGAQSKMLQRSVSVDTGLNRKVLQVVEEAKRPGYCENCRVKYDDFKSHIKTSKHRKFARNPENWVELDAVISDFTRPVVEYSEHEATFSADDDEDSGFFEAGNAVGRSDPKPATGDGNETESPQRESSAGAVGDDEIEEDEEEDDDEESEESEESEEDGGDF